MSRKDPYPVHLIVMMWLTSRVKYWYSFKDYSWYHKLTSSVVIQVICFAYQMWIEIRKRGTWQELQICTYVHQQNVDSRWHSYSPYFWERTTNPGKCNDQSWFVPFRQTCVRSAPQTLYCVIHNGHWQGFVGGASSLDRFSLSEYRARTVHRLISSRSSVFSRVRFTKNWLGVEPETIYQNKPQYPSWMSINADSVHSE